MALFLAVILTISVLLLDNLFSLFPVRAVAAENGLSEHTIDTVSPAHVTFNLFDYWVNTQDSAYNQGWAEQKGINQGHPLLFCHGTAGNGPYNAWTGNNDHYNTNHSEKLTFVMVPTRVLWRRIFKMAILSSACKMISTILRRDSLLLS